MNILASSHPLKLALDLSTDSLSKGTATLEQRRDYSEKLSEAFEELVTIAQAEESIAGSINSLEESGIFFSARSSFHSDLMGAISRLNSATVSSSDGSDEEESGKLGYPLKEPPHSRLDSGTERLQW